MKIDLMRKYREMSPAVRTSLWFTFCQFLQRGISFITVPVFTRLLTTEEYGICNVYFAWDILDNALKIEPGDPLLALSRSRLAPEVADYVKTVSRARQAESDKKYAAALNLYIAAQEIFPASQICRQGIERLAPLYDK